MDRELRQLVSERRILRTIKVLLVTTTKMIIMMMAMAATWWRGILTAIKVALK